MEPYYFDMRGTDLTGFQRDLLVVIAGLDEPHGLAIKEEMEDYYETEIHHGRLYPNLDQLVDANLVEKGELDKRTNRYSVTDRGRRVLEDHRAWEDQYVDELVDAGLVEKGKLDKRTNRYSVTDRGRRVLEGHRAWEDQYVDELRSG